MPDIFVMYPLAWLLFMGLGVLGYVITRGAGSGYLLLQLLCVPIVLYFLRDTFGAMEEAVWMVYAVLHYGLGWKVTVLRFLPFHLAGVVPGMLLRHHRFFRRVLQSFLRGGPNETGG